MSLSVRESAVVAACLELLAYRGCFVWRQNQGVMAATYKGKSRVIRFAGVTGIADIIGMTPAGQFIAVECKAGRNKATKEQEEFLERVRQRGGVAFLVYSSDQLLKELKAIGI